MGWLLVNLFIWHSFLWKREYCCSFDVEIEIGVIIILMVIIVVVDCDKDIYKNVL